MTEDQPRNLKPLLIGVVLIALLAGAWLAQPLYHGWKKQRYLKQAGAHLARSDYKSAAFSARQVRALDPFNLEAARILADIAERLRSPEVVAWRQFIADIEPDNPTNFIRLAEAALMFADATVAEQALSKVAVTNRATVEFHQAAAMVCASQRKIPEAEAYFRAALQLAPTNELLRLNHAVILVQARDTNIVAEGISTLQQFTADPARRRMALQNLSQAYSHMRDFPRAIEAASELAAGTNSTFADQMLLLSVLRTAEDASLPAQIASAQRRAVTAGPEQVQALAAWMIGVGKTNDALNWLTSLPADLQSQQRVSMSLADLYSARSDWSSLQSLTESVRWAEADFLRHAMRARAYREQRQMMSANAAWLEAVRAAGNNPKILSVLARLAGTWGWLPEQTDLLWALVERHPGERWAAPALHEIFVKSSDTRGLNRLAAALLAQNPRNLAAKNDLVSTSLLLGTQTARTHELAREIFAQWPSNEVTASTYAYSLFVQGNTKEAVDAFAGVEPNALEKPAIALYYGLVLGTNSPAQARKYLDLAAQGNLLPEEKNLLKDARKRL